MTRTILITGASRGIGRAVAIQCGRRGWSVGVNYAGNEQAAMATVTAIEAAGGKAIAIQGDVAVESDVIRMFDATEKAFGPITGVVNNAGIVAPGMKLVDMTAERFARMFAVNVTGAYLVARETARRMGTDRGGPHGPNLGGSLVNLSSAAARLGSPNEYVDYAGSKGAIDTMTIGLSKELASASTRSAPASSTPRSTPAAANPAAPFAWPLWSPSPAPARRMRWRTPSSSCSPTSLPTSPGPCLM